MTINIKYNIGDNIRYIYKEWTPKYIKCSCCNGKGRIIGFDLKQYDCPNCGSRGEIKDGCSLKKEIKEGTISCIFAQYDSRLFDRTTIWYGTPHDPKIFENDIIEKVVSEQEKFAYTE